MTVVTIVEGEVPREKQQDFEHRFHDLQNMDFPDGLLDTALLQDVHHPIRYRVETTWENSEKLNMFREKATVPLDVNIFKKVGVEPNIMEFNKNEELTVTCTP
jgi:hypothetical protein